MRAGQPANLWKPFLQGNGVSGSAVNLEAEEYFRLPPFKYHVFVCHNVRPDGAPRPSCTTDGKSDLHTQLQQLAKAAGLSDQVRINKSMCLDQCEHGPTVVVYPEAVWYGCVRPEDAAEIVDAAPRRRTARSAPAARR